MKIRPTVSSEDSCVSKAELWHAFHESKKDAIKLPPFLLTTVQQAWNIHNNTPNRNNSCRSRKKRYFKRR